MEQDESKTNVKIVIIGEAGVGKTSLMSKFVFNTFDDQMQPTIGCDIQSKTINIEGKKIEVRLWDTAGCERFQTMLPLYYRGCHGAILVYDVTRKDTFNKLRDWLLELENNLTNDDAVVMIVGNKIDKTGRKVSKEDGNNYAKQRSALFIETSAKTSEGVSIAFEELLMKIIQTPGLLDHGPSGINLGDNRGSNSGACGWASNVLSSLWNSVSGLG